MMIDGSIVPAFERLIAVLGQSHEVLSLHETTTVTCLKSFRALKLNF